MDFRQRWSRIPYRSRSRILTRQDKFIGFKRAIYELT